MPAYRIEGKGRGILLLPPNLSVGYQPQLDHRLKSVADSQSQPVSFLKQSHDRFL